MPRKFRKNDEKECECGCYKHHHWHGKCGGGLYGLGFIGAAVYYISNAVGFWMGVLGFLKALVWPAFLVFDLLKFIGA